MNRRNPEAMQRATERREREARAPRLAVEVPNLASLDIQIMERSSAMATDVAYIRRVVVPSASTLFEVPCGDAACVGGVHDFSEQVMVALRAGLPTFTGEDPCHGMVAGVQCPRIMRFAATATYRTA
jgi:hypothetical protein